MSTIHEAGWRPCPSGEFRRLAGRIASRRQRRQAFTVFFAAAALVTTGVAAIAMTHHMLADPQSAAGSPICPSRQAAPAAPSQPSP